MYKLISFCFLLLWAIGQLEAQCVTNNGTFESGYTGWSTTSGNNNGWNTSAAPFQGSAAANIFGADGINQSVAVSPNTTYRISGYYRTSGTISWGGGGFDIFNSSWTVLSSGSFFTTTNQGTYTYFETTVTTQSTATFIGVWASKTGTSNALHLDNICIEAVAVLAAEPPPGVSVRIANTSKYCEGGAITFYAKGTNNLNLVTNGNFTSGNANIGSTYTFSSSSACGNYNIANNSSVWGLPACTSSEPSGGNLMMVNTGTANANIWSQTVTVAQNTVYRFSVYAASITSGATLKLRIGGTDITTQALPTSSCQWTRIDAYWNSGTNTSAQLSIQNSNGSCTNNDFVLDDVTLVPAYQNGTYSWSGPNSFTSNLQNPIISNLSSVHAGTYTVTYTAGGTTATANYTLSLVNPCASCNGSAQIFPTPPTTCNGLGSLEFTEYGSYGTGLFEASIDGVNYFPNEYTFANLPVGQYHVQIRLKSNQQHCRTFPITLQATDNALFSGLSAGSANGCTATNGEITITSPLANSEISWLTSYTPTYVSVSSLTAGNKIQNLAPGEYFVQTRRIGQPFCVKEQFITVPNSGAACPSNAICTTPLGANRFANGSFGTGTAQNGTPLPVLETGYGFTTITCNAPDDGLYSIVNNTECNGVGTGSGVFNAWDVLTEDRTPGDVGGYMMLVNASFEKDIAFEKRITNLCSNTEYQFSLWIRNIYPPGPIKPNLTFLIDGVGKYNTGDITASGWIQVGFTFYTQSNTTATFAVRNNAPGGNGNDWLLDDIFVGICTPDVAISASSSVFCVGSTGGTISATVIDDQKQMRWSLWEFSTDNGATWNDLGLPVQSNFTGNSTQYTVTRNIQSPILATFNGYRYRLKVASNILNLYISGCNSTINAPSFNLVVSQTAVSITQSESNVCIGGSVLLTAAATGTGTFTYQWQISTDSTTFTNIASATSTTFTATLATAGTRFYRVVVTDNNGCVVNSNIVRIIFNNLPTVVLSSNGTAVCTGGGVQLTATPSAGVGSTCNMVWQSSPNGTTWTTISGASGNTYTVPSLSSNIQYRVRFVCAASGCCPP